MSVYFIRRHIFSVPFGQILLTRDFLQFGPRNTVDSSLRRLVKKEILLRIANGVFVRAGSKIPPVEEIAKAKAKRFGKKVGVHCNNIAVEMKVSGHKHDPCLFGTDGPTSSFGTVHYGRVKLERVSGRKRSLKNSKAAKGARALWSKRHADAVGTETVLDSLNRDERESLSNLMGGLPGWLGKQLVHRSLSTSVQKGAVFRPRQK